MLLLKILLRPVAALLLMMSGVTCVFAEAIPQRAGNSQSVNFTGHWELDYQLSDHANEKIRWEYQKARAEAQRLMQRSDRRVDPRMFNLDSIVGLGQLTDKIAQATVLDIKQETAHIVVNRSDDFALVCDFENPAPRVSAVGGEACQWDKDQLVFYLELPDGLTVLNRLSLAADRSRLNIATTVRVDGIRYPFTLNRVYKPYVPGEGMYQCEYTIARQTTCTLVGDKPESESGGQ